MLIIIAKIYFCLEYRGWFGTKISIATAHVSETLYPMVI